MSSSVEIKTELQKLPVITSVGILDSKKDECREELNRAYLASALLYVSDATDSTRAYAEEMLKDPRFNIWYETNFYPRFKTLAEKENSKNEVSRLRERYESVIFAQLSLMTGVVTLPEHLDMSTHTLHPSVVGFHLLQAAHVQTLGLYTPQFDTASLSRLETSRGERFSNAFIFSFTSL